MLLYHMIDRHKLREMRICRERIQKGEKGLFVYIYKSFVYMCNLIVRI